MRDQLMHTPILRAQDRGAAASGTFWATVETECSAADAITDAEGAPWPHSSATLQNVCERQNRRNRPQYYLWIRIYETFITEKIWRNDRHGLISFATFAFFAPSFRDVISGKFVDQLTVAAATARFQIFILFFGERLADKNLASYLLICCVTKTERL
ncbi:hypothetical protein J437_LFUL018642 [Ladona fulva]|uniref:Uncharacterized protein n=1 Tax=Ladona fulva TaxID=123851 RepID=A0A8K0KRY9_LADFU|nr:hypothetical protein J437_LFUL018642 [Ladona fulva]